jgi:hypothetical protein
VREKIQLYEEQLAVVERIQAAAPPAEAANLISVLANEQFSLYQVHFAHRSRLTRRPALLARMIQTLTGLRTRLASLPSSFHAGKNAEMLESRIRAWQAELAEIRVLRQTRTEKSLFGEMALDAERLLTAHTSAAKVGSGDWSRLGELCDELGELRRAMIELRQDDAGDRAAVDALTDRLLSIEAAYEASSRALHHPA